LGCGKNKLFPLAEAYGKGDGVPKNRREALDLYKAAAEASIFK